jgi:hypothetical protein
LLQDRIWFLKALKDVCLRNLKYHRDVAGEELPEGVQPLLPVEDLSWVHDEAAVKAYYDRVCREEFERLTKTQVLFGTFK